MNKKYALALLAIIVIAGLFYFFVVTKPNTENAGKSGQNNNNQNLVFDPKTCAYTIDDNISTNTQYFGNSVAGDFNNDGLIDSALIITQSPGGSGTFYYLAVALRKTDNSCLGTNAILLGDRIAPQTTEYTNGEIIVNYADRKLNEPMSAAPSIGVSRYFKVEANKLIEIKKETGNEAQNYNNSEYGFTLTLPESWKDYSIVKDVWNGELLIAPNTKYQGPKIIVRNPNWTEAKHWQDIPVLVFTPAEWKLIIAENLGVSAAPIGPSKLGENDKYVFALPPRWAGFTDDLGQDQAVEIVKTFKAY